MRLHTLFLVGLSITVLASCCEKNQIPEAVEPPPEVQEILDELNSIPPETADYYSCTEGGVISHGGIVPWISHRREQLDDLGFHVRWNCEKMQYEIVTEGQPIESICDCRQ